MFPIPGVAVFFSRQLLILSIAVVCVSRAILYLYYLFLLLVVIIMIMIITIKNITIIVNIFHFIISFSGQLFVVFPGSIIVFCFISRVVIFIFIRFIF